LKISIAKESRPWNPGAEKQISAAMCQKFSFSKAMGCGETKLSKGVIEVVESKSYMSVSEFCRRHKYNANLLNRLINQYKIKPDIKSGTVKLFTEERLKGIVDILDGNFANES